LTPFVRQELYQIAQEALNNALKHARAQTVRVLLDFQESATRLEVSDDGSGFEPAEADRGGGLGLRGMRERAQAIGGTLAVETAPGKGTTVHITVPADSPAG
jgi:signal transduction histidine kinase